MTEAPPVVIVMGPSGSGKSTLGRAVAEAAGLPFLEGDDFHPPRNRALMAAGVALTDEDRWPWLDALGAAARAAEASGGAVMACSALRRVYRDRLRAAIGHPVLFVLLDADRALLERRMAGRAGHYMPLSLLDSQIATLEPPGPDEPCLRLSAEAGMDDLVATVLTAMSA